MFKNATYGGSSVMVAQEFVALLDWFQIPTLTPKLIAGWRKSTSLGSFPRELGALPRPATISVSSSVGRTLVLGTSGQRFDSSLTDHNMPYYLNW